MAKVAILFCFAITFYVDSSNKLIASELTLRDANVATSLVSQCFPLRVGYIEYSGSVSTPEERRIDGVGEGMWILHYTAAEIDGQDHRVMFDVVPESMSDSDVPLHVTLDRVVYIHVVSHWSADDGWVMPSSFEENGVSIREYFEQCDAAALRYWESEDRFWDVLRRAGDKGE
jgi:hypothetical protein